MRASDDPVRPPDATLVRARWVSYERRRWAEDAFEVLQDYGVAQGSQAYESRYDAQNRARRLIETMVKLELAEQWQFHQRVNRRSDGRYVWAIEYVRSPNGRPAPGNSRPAQR